MAGGLPSLGDPSLELVDGLLEHGLGLQLLSCELLLESDHSTFVRHVVLDYRFPHGVDLLLLRGGLRCRLLDIIGVEAGLVLDVLGEDASNVLLRLLALVSQYLLLVLPLHSVL